MTTRAERMRAAENRTRPPVLSEEDRRRCYIEAAEYLTYHPDTGDLTWRKPYSRRVVGESAVTTSDGRYLYVFFDRQRLAVHRLALLISSGEYLPGGVDHINHNGKDNRLCNLRAASFSENAWNARVGVRNSSGYKGVSRARKSGQWQVRLHVEKKLVYYGLFDSKEEAAAAYAAADKKYRGDFACAAGPFLSDGDLRQMLSAYRGEASERDLDGWRSFADYLGIYKKPEQAHRLRGETK